MASAGRTASSNFSQFSFQSTGNPFDDVKMLIAIAEAQAKVIQQQHNDIEHMKEYLQTTSKSLISWDKNVKRKLKKRKAEIMVVYNELGLTQDHMKEKIVLLRDGISNLEDKIELNVKQTNAQIALINNRITNLPFAGLASRDYVEEMFIPLQSRIISLELALPKIKEDVKALKDDAKKGERVLEHEVHEGPVANVEPSFILNVEPSKKRKAVASTGSERPSVQRKLNMEEGAGAAAATSISAADIEANKLKQRLDGIAAKIRPDQSLELYYKKGLMVSHGKDFPLRERWVTTKEANNWYEQQREIFIKWYYVFANFSEAEMPLKDAWDHFFANHPQPEMVWLLRSMLHKAPGAQMRSPVFVTVTPPKIGTIISLSEIQRELNLLEDIKGLSKPKKKEEYEKLKRLVNRLYGQKF